MRREMTVVQHRQLSLGLQEGRQRLAVTRPKPRPRGRTRDALRA